MHWKGENMQSISGFVAEWQATLCFCCIKTEQTAFKNIQMFKCTTSFQIERVEEFLLWTHQIPFPFNPGSQTKHISQLPLQLGDFWLAEYGPKWFTQCPSLATRIYWATSTDTFPFSWPPGKMQRIKWRSPRGEGGASKWKEVGSWNKTMWGRLCPSTPSPLTMAHNRVWHILIVWWPASSGCISCHSYLRVTSSVGLGPIAYVTSKIRL